MGRGRPKAELVLEASEQAQLISIARSRSVPAALVLRARIVLACAAGESNSAVARRFELRNSTVGKWRGRFVKYRINGRTTRSDRVGHAPSMRNAWRG
jgi:transposase-like protein